MADTRPDVSAAQAQLDADPTFQQLLGTFRQTQSPADWASAADYANNHVLNSAGRLGRWSIQIGGDGRVGLQDRNNPWTSISTWGPILVGAATLGTGLLAGAGAGAGGAGGGVLTSHATVPTMGSLAPSLGPVGPGLAAAGLSGGTAALDAGAGGTGAGLARSVANGAASGLSGSNLMKAIALLGSALGGRALASNAASDAVPPQLTDLLNLSVDRAHAQQPLFNAVNQGAYAMLPNFSKPPGA